MEIVQVKTKTGKIYFYQNGRRISQEAATKTKAKPKTTKATKSPTKVTKAKPKTAKTNLKTQESGLSSKMLSDLVGETIKICYVHPVTLKIVLLSFHSDFDTGIKNLDWEFLVFGPEITSFHISSSRTGNKDSRGGGCGNLWLPLDDFKYKITNKNGITLANVTEAAYRMKGSKYDWWYELYSGLTIKKRTKTAVHAEINFDYGS